MQLRELDIKAEYQSLNENVVVCFYEPVLKNSILYRRAVGFFSSSALIELSYGISELVKNGGKIKIIASPYLSVEDIQAINCGQKVRDEVINSSLVESLIEPIDCFEEERLNYIANLISRGILEIKLAICQNNDKLGMYHEKIGLMEDSYGDMLAFTGSMNESSNSFRNNYESIDVFCSWKNETERVNSKNEYFDKLWNNQINTLIVSDFPKVAINEIMKYKKDDRIELNLDEYLEKNESDDSIKVPIELYEYQKEAIQSWKKQGYRGIFSMATGSGKTITSLAALVNLYYQKDEKLAVVIVCPFQHLVEQWVEDLVQFNILPIIGYSNSTYAGYIKKLRTKIINYNRKKKDFFCFICTNSTFISKNVQNELNNIEENALLIVDEAHYFGAEKMREYLTDRFDYRLALSATIKRHWDKEGTTSLMVYFGGVVYEYSIERAIEEKKLTPYKYYPIFTALTPDEYIKYIEISGEIKKYITFDELGNPKMTDAAKFLLIQRARVVAGSVSKVEALMEIIQRYKADNHLLIYCGATGILDQDGYDEFEDMRQIEYVCNRLRDDYKMHVETFTSNESSDQRKLLLQQFDQGNNVQGLVAIKCLDEGVNVPSMKTAFVLASSTNPKEYIQRRGRLLRKYPGKEYAEIYDFISLPCTLEFARTSGCEFTQYDKALINRELIRVFEYNRLALNCNENEDILDEVAELYNYVEGTEDE